MGDGANDIAIPTLVITRGYPHSQWPGFQGDLIAFNRGITSCEKATAWQPALRFLQHLTEEEPYFGRNSVRKLMVAMFFLQFFDGENKGKPSNPTEV